MTSQLRLRGRSGTPFRAVLAQEPRRVGVDNELTIWRPGTTRTVMLRRHTLTKFGGRRWANRELRDVERG